MINVYKDLENLLGISKRNAQYGQNYRPISKHQYDDCITGLSFSAILQ